MMRSELARLLAPALILSLLLTASGAAADGTGAPSIEVSAQLAQKSDTTRDKAHLERLKALARRRNAVKSATNRNQVGLLRWSENPGTLPTAFSLGTPHISPMEVADANGSCVRCGVAATLITLRFFKSIGRLAVDDLSGLPDSQALKVLGDGFLAGAPNPDYAIMRATGVSSRYGNQYQMKANLNVRQRYDPYIISSSENDPDASALSAMLRYPIWVGKPVILLVDARRFVYYKGVDRGRFVVMDGWASGGASHWINDPNVCSKTAPQDHLCGVHLVTQTETKNALDTYGTANVLW